MLHHSHSLAESVLKGITPLDTALTRPDAVIGFDTAVVLGKHGGDRIDEIKTE